MITDDIFDFFLKTNSSKAYIFSGMIFLGLFLIFKFFDSYFVYILQRATKKTKTVKNQMSFFSFNSFKIKASVVVDKNTINNRTPISPGKSAFPK